MMNGLAVFTRRVHSPCSLAVFTRRVHLPCSRSTCSSQASKFEATLREEGAETAEDLTYLISAETDLASLGGVPADGAAGLWHVIENLSRVREERDAS